MFEILLKFYIIFLEDTNVENLLEECLKLLEI